VTVSLWIIASVILITYILMGFVTWKVLARSVRDRQDRGLFLMCIIAWPVVLYALISLARSMMGWRGF